MTAACPTSFDPEIRQRLKPWALLGLASFPVSLLISIALLSAYAYGGMDVVFLVPGILVTFAIRRLVSFLAVRKMQAIAGETPKPWTYTLVLAFLMLVCAIGFASKWSFFLTESGPIGLPS